VDRAQNVSFFVPQVSYARSHRNIGCMLGRLCCNMLFFLTKCRLVSEFTAVIAAH